MNRWLSGTTLLFVAPMVLAPSCKDKAPLEGSGPSRSASADPAPVVVPEPVRPAIPERAVPSSFTPDDDRWVRAFRFAFPDDAKMGVSFHDAREACLRHRLDLCTVDQWEIACRAEASVGKAESWTISPAAGSGWELRGGSGCSSRSKATDGSPATGRIGLCCERRASIHGDSRREKVLESGQVYVDLCETAQNAGEPTRVLELLADRSQVHKNQGDKDAHRADLEGDLQRWPEMDTRHTRCEYSSKGSDGSFTCEVVMTRLPAGKSTRELAVFRSLYEFVDFKYTVFANPISIVRPWGPY
jgi:hypothetical protein